MASIHTFTNVIVIVVELSTTLCLIIFFYFSPPANDNADENADDDHQNNNSGIDMSDHNMENDQPAPRKKKIARKQISTVTKNKESLNARLDTIAPPEPLFSKLNSIMGDVSSSNRLLLSILQTNLSDLKLSLDGKFWDDTPCEPIDLNKEFDFTFEEENCIEFPAVLPDMSKLTLRQQQSGYGN